MRLCVLVAAAMIPVLPVAASAQAGDTASDPVMQKVQELVDARRETEARRLVDSVLANTPPGRGTYADALYWRASHATNAASAERDYQRLLIEAPLSQRAEDGMLQLAQLTQARGDRKEASDLMQRFLVTYAHNPARPRVAISLVRLLFELGPTEHARACEAVQLGRDAIPSDNLELRNQLDYYAPRCEGIALARPTDTATAPAAVPRATEPRATEPPAARPRASAPTTRDTAPASTTRRSTTPARTANPTATTTPAAFYSVQLAAYDTRADAQRLVQVLRDRDIEARIDGTARPFRVRVGRYRTRAEAVKAAADLKARGHDGFVAIVRR